MPGVSRQQICLLTIFATCTLVMEPIVMSTLSDSPSPGPSTPRKCPSENFLPFAPPLSAKPTPSHLPPLQPLPRRKVSVTEVRIRSLLCWFCVFQMSYLLFP
ncbi:hypothetical protein BDQ17DRAFT_1340858 [Cyathus striatus]|nr:hypothetical protein BDQ17DRAFT_1340858 [Cyathus striatus]